jgi:hypothetical protein
MMPWWQTNDDNNDLMSVQILVIVIRLSSRHHVCLDPCYRHSSVIKASCLFRSLLSSFVCHQGIMSVQILVIVIRLSMPDDRRMTITRIWTDMMPWWQTNDDNKDLNIRLSSGIMSVQIIVIIIRLSSRHHVCSDPCYRHSSVIRHHVCSDHCYGHSTVIKASCLFGPLLSSFACNQGFMMV